MPTASIDQAASRRRRTRPSVIVAPASFAKPERIGTRPAALAALGFAPKLGRNTLQRGPLYFAGTAAQRLADLHAAFADPNTSAVMACAAATAQTICSTASTSTSSPQHPKPFFAYSDLTGIQLRLLDELGLPAFHGPMLAADFYLEDGVHLASFQCGAGRRALQPSAQPKACAL